MGTVKIFAFTRSALSLFRFCTLPFHVFHLPAGLQKELNRSCMIETDCGFHLAYPQCERVRERERDEWGFLEGKIPKAPAAMREILARFTPSL